MFQRISQRLAALIGIALLALVLSSINAIWQLRQAASAIESLNDNIIPSFQLIGHAREAALESRALAGQHIMSPEEAQMQVVEQRVNQVHDSLQDVFSRYSPLTVNAEDKALLAAEVAAAQAYTAVHGEVLRLSRANDDEGARHLMLAKMLPASDALLAALARHDDFNEKLAKQAEADSDRSMKAGNWFTALLLSVTIVGLMLVAWRTYSSIVRATSQASQEMQRVARELDFSHDLQVHGRDEIADMVRAFNGLMQRLRDGLALIREQTMQLAHTSNELAASSTQVVTGSNRQNDAAARMAANIEEVTVSISHVSSRADEASHYAMQSGEQAVAGRRAVDDMVQRIGEISGMVDQASGELARLEDEGRQIGAVVNVIKEVADQTNLLALNAAIEAARAGEQGRGFAVVADEVRKLAERTASSTVEIARMVAAVQQSSAAVSQQMARAVEAVRVGVAEGEGTRHAIDRIAEASGQSGSLVSEIAAAMREQSSASNDIATQVERVAQMADENSHTAQRSTQLTDELHQMAESMKTVVEQYRL